MKKLLKRLTVVLVSVFMSLSFIGCTFVDNAVESVNEQKIELYNYREDESGNKIEETIDTESKIHLIFPANTDSNISTKLKAKAVLLQVTIKFKELYTSVGFNVNLRRDAYGNNISVKLDDRVYTDAEKTEIEKQMMEAVTLDNITIADDIRIAPYKRSSDMNENDAYTRDGLALKATIDVKKLSTIQGFQSLQKDDYVYAQFQFTLVSKVGISTKTVYYNYMNVDGDFVPYGRKVSDLDFVGSETVKTEYKVGEELDFTGLEVYGLYNDYADTKIKLEKDQYTIDTSAVKTDTAGEYNVFVTFMDITKGFRVTFVEEEEIQEEIEEQEHEEPQEEQQDN